LEFNFWKIRGEENNEYDFTDWICSNVKKRNETSYDFWLYATVAGTSRKNGRLYRGAISGRKYQYCSAGWIPNDGY
jgi:hypothetical protein